MIVHLYEEHGEACVEHLRGMFAFALWDRRRRRLLLARDRVGKKPLFYAQRGGTLWYGSEVTLDAAGPGAAPGDGRRGDRPLPRHWLRAGPAQRVRGVSASFRRPTRCAGVDGRATTRRYWRLRYGGHPHGAEEEELREELREHLLEATRLRLRSDVPLGAFLSGGVDSSAVVAAMTRTSSARVKTFAIGFDVGAYDETAHAREVAQLLGTEHHEFRVTPDAIDVLPRLVWHYGEPFADPSAIPTFHLSELARRYVTVALNGDGGDESFAGYERYATHALLGRLPRVPAGPAWLQRALEHPVRPALLRRLAWAARTLPLTAPERYARSMMVVTPTVRERLYTPAFRAQSARRTRRPRSSGARSRATPPVRSSCTAW